MQEKKRYDVSGMPRGAGRPYPNGTILKMTEEEAKRRGLGDAKVSDLTTTADSVTKANRYEEAMTSQDRMRETEAAASTSSTDDTDAGNKARGTRSR